MNDIKFILICVLVIVVFIIFRIYKFFYNKNLYEATTYFHITNIPYLQILNDVGHYGEYQIYKHLRYLELENTKFLFNLYIPIFSDKTTEIDVIMIAPQGIFVFESKNYSGWIFGTESQKKWTQSLHIGYGNTKKEHFFNPIMQNKYHIKYLEKLLEKKYTYHSIIVFSDDCEFKNITRTPNSNSYLIYRRELNEIIHDIMLSQSKTLSTEDILYIYNKLYSYSQVDKDTKVQHIKNLKLK